MSDVLTYIPYIGQEAPPPPPPSGSKVPLSGLVVRRVSDINGRPGDLGGVVADVHWEDLQPTAGGPINTASGGANGFSQITAAIATGLPWKLRAHAGQYSPTWAMSAGGSFAIADPDANMASVTVPKFWTPAYLDAWGSFMTELAKVLEGEPSLREVASHPATTIFAEPLIRNQRGTFTNGAPYNPQIMYNNGLRLDTDLAALKWPADIVGGKTRWESYGWTTTRYYMPFNPYVYFDGTKQLTSVAKTIEIINYVGQNMRSHCVLGNNSVRVPLWVTGSAWITGQAQAGGSSSITLSASQSPAPTETLMVGAWIGIRSGTGVGQVRTVTAYNPSTRVATVDSPWTVTPSGSSAYALATTAAMDNGYTQMYKAMNDLGVCVAIQQGSNTQVPAAYREVPGHASATELEALIATTDVGFGLIYDPGHDPENFVTGGLGRMKWRYQEIPGAWNSWGLSSAKCAEYNALGASMPIGV